MKKLRMSTLMLLVVIAALCLALVVQERRHNLLEVEWQASRALLEANESNQEIMLETERARSKILADKLSGK